MLKKLRLNVSSLSGLLLLVFSLWAIANQLRQSNHCGILNSLAAIPKSPFIWTIWLTALGYLVMIGYDILGFSYTNAVLSLSRDKN